MYCFIFKYLYLLCISSSLLVSAAFLLPPVFKLYPLLIPTHKLCPLDLTARSAVDFNYYVGRSQSLSNHLIYSIP